MKTKFYLGAAAALALGLGFTSCSSDEPAGGDQTTTPVGEERYMTVRIQTAGMGGTRSGDASFAEGDAEFEAAANNKESNITAETIRFYFFTEDGNPYIMSAANVNGEVSNTNMVKPTQIAQTNSPGETPSIEGVLVLGVSADQGYLGTSPAKVVCVANSNNFAAYANHTLSELKAMRTASLPSVWDSFLMTSSTYYDESQKDNGFNGEIFYSDIKDKVKKTHAEALADPADIYIERLAAKVRVTGIGVWPSLDKDNTDATASYTFVNATGTTETKKLNVRLTGWRMHNLANNTYNFKNIDRAITNPPFDGWNDLLRHRSYWAITPSSSQLTQNSYDIYDNTQFYRGNFDSSKPTENIRYIYPNTQTPDCSPTTRLGNATAIVVRGVVEFEDGTPANIVYWGGTYYEESVFKSIVVNAYNADKDDSAKITEADVAWTSNSTNNTWGVRVRNNDGGYTTYSRFSNVSRWIDGVTSFYANIQHFGKKIGVVRNHIYDYEFNGVIGLGVPGNDIVDPKPEEETWLSARITVLNWHVVKNSILLQ